jgi:hypothetical protein
VVDDWYSKTDRAGKDIEVLLLALLVAADDGGASDESLTASDKWHKKVLNDSPEYVIGEALKSPQTWCRADQWVVKYFEKVLGANPQIVATAATQFQHRARRR